VATQADLVIDALHAGDDQLAPLVRSFTPQQLTRPTAEGEWTLAQVLSHLGSGAVIARASLEAALSGAPNPGQESMQAVWAVWNAMTPQEQADGYLAANAELLGAYDAIDAATRESVRVDMGFLPEPVDLAFAARFRLNEFALHSWDVRVLADPAATVEGHAAPLLLDQAAFMLGWIAKSAPLDGTTASLAVTLTDPDHRLGLLLADPVALGDVPTDPDGTLTLPTEAWLRLLTGRLTPEHTPTSVAATGAADLDTLRQVFPGY